MYDELAAVIWLRLLRWPLFCQKEAVMQRFLTDNSRWMCVPLALTNNHPGISRLRLLMLSPTSIDTYACDSLKKLLYIPVTEYNW